VVADQLGRVTGLDFLPDRSSLDGEFGEKSEWCLECKRTGGHSPFLWRCWEDKEGSIWLESPQFIDVVESIKKRHKRTIFEKAKKFDFTEFGKEEVQKRFANDFSLPNGRIAIYRNYEEYVADKRGVDLNLRFEGSVGLLLLSYAIRLAKKDEPVSEDRLENAVETMNYLQRQILYEESTKAQ